jgi:hypothetical protein
LAQTPIAIRTNTARARKQPDANAAVIATLHKGETFVVTKDLPYWYRIKLRNGATAYVAKSLCVVVEDEEEQSWTDDVPTDAPSAFGDPPIALPGCTPHDLPADFSICPATGSGGMYAEAYRQKNRLDVGCAFQPITVAEVMGLRPLPKNVRSLPEGDPDFKYLKSIESTPVRIEGYFAMTKKAGEEGVNCSKPDRLDLRMELVNELVADPKLTRKSHMVAEASPWFQAQVAAWTVSNLGKYSSYKNGFADPLQRPPTQIRVYGHLFFDEAHAYDGSVGTIRGTAWEIHPVVRIEIRDGTEWKTIE